MDLIKKALISTILVVFFMLPASASTQATVVGTAPFGALTDAELDFYGKSLSYAMSTLKDDQVYDWRTSKAEGQIRMGQAFKNKYGQTCRGFSEMYTIEGVSGTNTGYACERDGDDGWCKLKEGNMMSCAFEPADGWIDKTIETVGTINNKANALGSNASNQINNSGGSGDSANIGGIVGGAINSVGSSVGAPSVGRIETPEVPDELREKAKPSNAAKWWD